MFSAESLEAQFAAVAERRGLAAAYRSTVSLELGSSGSVSGTLAGGGTLSAADSTLSAGSGPLAGICERTRPNSGAWAEEVTELDDLRLNSSPPASPPAAPQALSAAAGGGGIALWRRSLTAGDGAWPPMRAAPAGASHRLSRSTTERPEQPSAGNAVTAVAGPAEAGAKPPRTGSAPINISVTANGTGAGVASAMLAAGPLRSLAGRSRAVFYLAPERVLGQRISDRVDVFAIGVLIYELLSVTLLTTPEAAGGKQVRQLEKLELFAVAVQGGAGRLMHGSARCVDLRLQLLAPPLLIRVPRAAGDSYLVMRRMLTFSRFPTGYCRRADCARDARGGRRNAGSAFRVALRS